MLKVGFVTKDGITVNAEITTAEETDFRKTHGVVGFIHNTGLGADALEALAFIPFTGDSSIKTTLECSHAEAFLLGQRYERLATFPRLRKIKQQLQSDLVGRENMGYEYCLGCDDAYTSPIVSDVLKANGMSLEELVEEINRGCSPAIPCVTLEDGILWIQGCVLNLGRLLDAAAECMKRQIPAV